MNECANDFSVDVLRSHLNYIPETGDLIWRAFEGLRKRAGRVAGNFDRDGYKTIHTRGIRMQAHRVAWAIYYGEWPCMLIDHINGVRDDNRICNLRLATVQQNAANRGVSVKNKYGARGITLLPNGKWQAIFRGHGKSQYLGLFVEKFDAMNAYDDAAKAAHGEFARATVPA